MDMRPLGKTDMRVSAVALGCWPIAGMTSPGTSEADSLATIGRCFDLGINFLDTAYCYGADGESERLIAQAVGSRRDELVIATKGGIHWSPEGQQVLDARPETLRREADVSLARLKTDCVDLLYLHVPDPNTPIAESAGALKDLLDAGKTRTVGASNCTVEQLQQFAEVCPLSAYQPPYNMLQREIERGIIPWCQARGVSVMVYWPLLKGLLAGRLARDHQFAEGDSRRKYPMFHGQEWEKNLDLVDALRPIAEESNKTVAQLVINWTIHQDGICSALCGAKRADQIEETAGGADWQLTPDQCQRIEAALERRGQPETDSPV
jgi:aryl-alcohol dehydrogenase-like predicted oxidoreductase